MIYQKSFVHRTQKIYWLHEQQGASGNFASCLDRYLKNWVKWAKAGLGEVTLPEEIYINLSKNIDSELRWQLRCMSTKMSP